MIQQLLTIGQERILSTVDERMGEAFELMRRGSKRSKRWDHVVGGGADDPGPDRGSEEHVSVTNPIGKDEACDK